MARDPYAGGYYSPGGGGYDDGSDDDSGGSDGGGELPGNSGSIQPTPDPDPDPVDLSPGDSDDDGVPDVTDPAPNLPPADPAPSPGGSSPPPSDVGGPGGSDDSGSSGGSSGGELPGNSGSIQPTPDPQPEPETISGSTTIAADATPGPRAPVQPGGDSGVVDDVVGAIVGADANETLVDRATTGGFLSERGESAGLVPDQVGGVDVSETRLREAAQASARIGDQVDVGAIPAAQAALVSPITGSAGVDPSATDLDVRTDAPRESPVENVAEGAASLPFDLPAGVVTGETAAEAAQSSPGVVQDFDAGTIGETSVAVGRDKAVQTAAAAADEPAEFAGAVSAGLLLGGASAAKTGGVSGGLRAAARAEVDPRVGPVGETFEFRALSRFLDDDRGQLQMGRQRSPDADSDADTVADDSDLGPDIDPFDRSDARLYDPSREFDDDVGGMADAPDRVDPTEARSREDIGDGISGRGDPQMAPGVDADSFSERGFGDVSGTSLDPNPTDTLGRFDRLSPGVDAGVGGVLGGASQDERVRSGAGAGGLLGDPGGFDATGATPDVGERTRTITSPSYDPGSITGPALDPGPTTTQPRSDPGDSQGGRDMRDTSGETRIGTRTRVDTRTDQTPDVDQPPAFDTGTTIDTQSTVDTDTGTDTPDPDRGSYDRERYDPARVDVPDLDRDVRFELNDERDDEAMLFGTRTEDRQFGSGILSGEAAISEFLGR